jgi:SpoVK/Ycf46/Vps4 family AAA+-type ATPase
MQQNELFYMDPTNYNNYLLVQNIQYLSSLSLYEIPYLRSENDKLKAENDELKKQVIDLQFSKSQIIVPPIQIPIKSYVPTKIVNKFIPSILPPTDNAWTQQEITKVIASIKSIDDIIKLDNKWEQLQHCQILQRFYFLIPPLIKLQKMIGLENIKKDVFKKIIYYIQNPHNDEYLHTIISGPPGTGKTEFAKIYAEIFQRLGVLQTDKFIEITRNHLVAEFIGQTGPKTKKLLDEAMGGVLFLDEAYSLGHQEKQDPFTKEAVDMLTQILSERKNDFMFIIAGYKEDLDSCLFAHNKGLRRRFHSHYHIEKYTPLELCKIFLQKISQAKYTLIIANDELDNFFIKNKQYFQFLGGDVEKLVNEIKLVQSLRCFYNNSKDKNIIIDDIITAFNIIKENKSFNEPPIFMYL